MADAQIQNGFGCVWGVSTTKIDTDPSAGISSGQLFPLEEDLTITRQSDPNFDPPTGAVIGETWFRKESNLRVRLYPAGSTLTEALNANNQVIEPGQELTIVDTSNPEIGKAWTVVEVGKARRHQEKAYWDLTLRRHGNNSQPYSSTPISQLTPN